MAFPNNIDEFSTKVDGTVHWATHQNELQDAIIAIETYLGTKGNSHVVVVPEGGVLPPPAWVLEGVNIGIYPNGTIKAVLNWTPLVSNECVSYIIQRAITASGVTIVPTEFDTIATVSGKDNSSYVDAAGLKVGFKYWYRIAGQNINGENGFWSTIRGAEADSDVVIGNPSNPVDLYIYVDGQGNLFGGWTYISPDMGSNWYLGANVVINMDANPVTGPLRGETFVGYPTNSCNLSSLWHGDLSQITINTILYFHVKTLNQWGLESGYVTYGPFSMGQIIARGYTSYQWSAYSNFKTLLENHFYDDDGNPYTYSPGTFIAEGPDLLYLGDKIAAGTIQTQALAVGSGHRNFDIVGLEFHQNESWAAGTDEPVNNPNWLRVTTTCAMPMLMLITDPDKEANGALTYWIISGFNGTSFAQGPDIVGVSKEFAPLESSKPPYNVYMKCSKTSNTDAQVYVTSEKMAPDGVGYYYYLLGMWDVRENKAAQLGLSYGFTFIDGNHITTGTIDCNKVNVHAAGSDVTISGNGIDILNGKMTFSTGTTLNPLNNLIINEYGIECMSNDTGFKLRRDTGLDLKFGANNFMTLNKSGLNIVDSSGNRLEANSDQITLTGGDDNSVVFDNTGLKGKGFSLTSAGLDLTGSGAIPGLDTTVGPYNGTHLDSNGVWTGSGTNLECVMGQISSGVYGFLAGTSYSTGKRAILTKDGLKCYGADNKLMFDTNTNMISAAYGSLVYSIPLVLWMEPESGQSSIKEITVKLLGFGALGRGYNRACAQCTLSGVPSQGWDTQLNMGLFVTQVLSVDASSADIIIFMKWSVPVPEGMFCNLAANLMVYMFKTDDSFVYPLQQNVHYTVNGPSNLYVSYPIV